MSIKASEISSVIRDQINNFENQADISEGGTVLKVGDGVAQVYGLDNVQAGEMVEFDGGVKGCLLYTSPSPRDRQKSRMPSSA